MSNSPITLVANCPDPIARSTAYGNLPITFSGPVRYYPTPESRWNLCRETWTGRTFDRYSAVVQTTPNLAAYWKLAETSGTTAGDSSGNSRNLTYTGSPSLVATTAVPSNTDEAVDFNGSTQYAIGGGASNTGLQGGNALSLECWVVADAFGNRCPAGLFGSGTDKGYWINVTATGIGLWISTNGSNQTLCEWSTTINANTVYHIVGTFDGSNARIYINGVLRNTVAITGPVWTVATASAFAIGRLGALSSDYFDGRIDDVAVYNRALTLAEIQQHYNAGLMSGWSSSTGLFNADAPLPSGGGTGSKFTIVTAASAGVTSDNTDASNRWRFRSVGEQHTFSVDVYQATGSSRNVSLTVNEVGGTGTTSGTSSNVSVPSGTWTTVSYTYTPSRKVTFAWTINTTTALGWAANNVVYFRNPMIEPGVATRGSYFDAQTSMTPAVVCWDQRTYFAKAATDTGVAITNPGWFWDHWNNNLITNPFGEVNTTGRTFTNCSGARTQDYAIQGAWSVRLTATGANATDASSITATANDYILHAIVTNETASARTCQWTYDGVAVAGSAVSVPAYGQAVIRGLQTAVAGSRAFALQWTNSANTETFITQYLYVGVAPLSGFSSGVGPASCIPTIDDAGAIASGWIWLGTAHSSASGGYPMIMSVPIPPHLVSSRGSVIERVVRVDSWQQGGGGDRAIINISSPASPGTDSLRLDAGQTNTRGSVYTADKWPGGSPSTVTSSVGQLVSTTEDLCMQWDDDQFSVHSIGLWDRIGTRKSNVPSGKLSGSILLSYELSSGILRQSLCALRTLTDAERNQIHNTAGVWSLDIIDNLQPDNTIIKPRANYNGPVPDASVGAGLTDVLISAQGGHMWRTFNAWNLAASWVINDHGTFACAIEMDDVSAYCTTAQALQGRDIRWKHPTAGWWRGVITAVVPRPDDRTVEVTAKGYSWWLSKRVTPKIAKFPGAPPGGIISAVLQASKREATLPFDSIQIDETGAPFAYETRAGNVLDVVRGVTSRSGQEWQNDMDANQFQWRQEMGRDLSAQIQLVDNIHIVDHRPEFSLDAKANALLVQPTDDRYKARNSFFAEDGASIDAYGRLEDGRTYAGAANRSSLRVISKSDLKRSARRGQTFSFTIADVADCMGWFRNGDTIRLSLPRINQAFSVRVMVRSWDSDSGLMTCSGYAS